MKIEHSFIVIFSMLFIVGCGGGSTGGDTGNAGGSTTGSSKTNVVEGDASTQTADAQDVISNPYPADLLTDDKKKIFLDLINDARSVQQDCGSKGVYTAASPLAWSDKLYSTAAEHSNDMAQSNTFSHDGSATDSDWTGMDTGKASKISDRIENNGYTDWRKIGENIAAGSDRDTAQEAVNAWLESDAHCAILMSTEYTEVGMAMVENSQSTYTYYWTQNFGNR